MANNALYFPYIRVPESTWFTQVLLYWDRVGSIVPYEFLHDPDRLGSYMVDLVRVGLVEQVIPGAHIYDIPRFDECFLDYVDAEMSHSSWIQRLRRTAVHQWEEIHAEKMENIGEGLVKRGLARPKSGSWYVVEPHVAAAFMAYLAAVLGRRPDLNFVPITDRESALKPFLAKRPGLFVTVHKSRALEDLRAAILSEVLPAPAEPLPPQDLMNFKARYQKELVTFRGDIEALANKLALISDEKERKRTAELELGMLKLQIEEIANRMKLKWPKIIFGSLCAIPPAVLGALPAGPHPAGAAIAGAAGLAAAIYTAAEPFMQRSEARKKPPAYAVLVQEKFHGAATHLNR